MKPSKFKLLLAVLLSALSFSPTSLWACAACTGRTDSPLAVAMNWGILTLLCVVLTVLSGVLVFFVHVIRKEESATHDTPPENSPKT
jgi:heme/copper-type cytochrome/quinol oxidase subunit 2